MARAIGYVIFAMLISLATNNPFTRLQSVDGLIRGVGGLSYIRHREIMKPMQNVGQHIVLAQEPRAN
jgi:hypothetical protein